MRNDGSSLSVRVRDICLRREEHWTTDEFFTWAFDTDFFAHFEGAELVIAFMDANAQARHDRLGGLLRKLAMVW